MSYSNPFNRCFFLKKIVCRFCFRMLFAVPVFLMHACSSGTEPEDLSLSGQIHQTQNPQTVALPAVAPGIPLAQTDNDTSLPVPSIVTFVQYGH